MEFLLQNLNTSLIVLAIAFSIILHYLAKNNKHRKQKSPPEAGGAWPILGHFLTFSRPKKLPHVALGEMADKYGPAFTIRLGVHKVLVISDWKMAKELCTSHDAHISSRPNFRAAKHLGYNYAMLPFTPYGPYWREIRKLTSTELLSKKRLEQLKHIRVSEIETSVKELYKVWTEKRFSGRVLVDMKKWFSDLTFNVLLQMVAGKRIGDEKEGRRCQRVIRDFVRLLWYLWIAYNEAIYDDSTFSATYTIKRIKRESVLLSLSRPFHRHHESDSFLLLEGLIARFSEPPRRKIIRVQWLAPPSGRLKLNTDAMLSSNGAAGGACLRDSYGCILAGICFPLDASSALEAEVLALRFAIQWCEITAKIPALVEVDSLSIANFISSSTTRIPWKIKQAILYIRSCLMSWGSSITHIYREANQVADALATEGLCRSSPFIFGSFSSLPVNVKISFMYDFRGFAFTRLI